VHRSGPQTNFHYDGQDIIQETAPGRRRPPLCPRPRHRRAPRPVRRRRHGDKRWLHADERGSIVALSDQSGNATAINRYDEYGIPAQGNVGLFQYTGHSKSLRRLNFMIKNYYDQLIDWYLAQCNGDWEHEYE
jgi:hypothetical protein